MQAVRVFHDQDPRSQNAALEVMTHCKELNVDCKPVQVDAFDIIEAAQLIRSEVRRFDRSQVVFNITGGTTVLSCAALLVSVLDGIRAESVDLRDLQAPPKPLPLLTISYKELLTDAQRTVLKAIADHSGEVTQRDLVRVLGLRKATVSHHIKTLKRRGLVVGKSAKDGRMEYLEVPASASLLLVDEPPAHT